VYDGLRNTFVECVLADHDAYKTRRAQKEVGQNVDLRLAMTSCLSMFHFHEHVFGQLHAHPLLAGIPRPKSYEQYLVSVCRELAVVRDAAHVHKHHTLGHRDRVLTSVMDVESVVIATEYRDDAGSYRIAEKEIRVTLGDGSRVILHECLAATRQMWWAELERLGVLTRPRDVPQPEPPFPPAREIPGEAARLDIRWRNGERLRETMILHRFDYASMSSSPVDCSGATLQMNMRSADQPPAGEDGD